MTPWVIPAEPLPEPSRFVDVTGSPWAQGYRVFGYLGPVNVEPHPLAAPDLSRLAVQLAAQARAKGGNAVLGAEFHMELRAGVWWCSASGASARAELPDVPGADVVRVTGDVCDLIAPDPA